MTDYSDIDMDISQSEAEGREVSHRRYSRRGNTGETHDRKYGLTDISSDTDKERRNKHRHTMKSVIVVPDKGRQSRRHHVETDVPPSRKEKKEKGTRSELRLKYMEDDTDTRKDYRESKRPQTAAMKRDRDDQDRRRHRKYRETSTDSSSEQESEEELVGAVGGRRAPARHERVKKETSKKKITHYKERVREDGEIEAGNKVGSVQNMKIRHYDGNTSWETFLIQFEIGARYNRWSESQKVAQLQCCLSGKAAQALWDTDIAELTSYDQLVDRLKMRFSSTTQKERFVEELRSRRRKPNETLSDLHADIRRLFALAYGSKVMSADVSEAIARDYFIASLDDPDLEIKVKEKDPIGLDDALKAAIRAETHMRSYERAAERSGRIKQDRPARENFRSRFVKGEDYTGGERESENTRLMKQLLQQMDACQKQTADLSREVEKMRLQKEHVTASPPDRKIEFQRTEKSAREEGRCHLCGETGHFRDKCPSRAKTRNGNSSKVCYNCGLPGHIKRDCKETKKRDDRSEQEAKKSSGINREDEGQRVYLEVEFESGKQLVLLDTGSEITLFPASLAGIQSMRQTSQKVMAANGTDIGIIGVANVSARLRGNIVQLEGYVTPNVEEIIIGVDILRKWKCVWNFGNNTVKIFGVNIKLLARPRQNACRRIVLAEGALVPAHCEMIVSGNIVFSEGTPEKGHGKWATVSRQVENGVYVASAVMPDRVIDVPVRVANITGRPVELREGFQVTELIPVELCCEHDSYMKRVDTCETVWRGGRTAENANSNEAGSTISLDGEKQSIIDQMVDTVSEGVDDEQRARLKMLLMGGLKPFHLAKQTWVARS